jgi:quercetin dioxygenase-like cupin family protein
MNIKILPVPRGIHKILSGLPGWRETDISYGRTIAMHAHNFFAMYFVFGVKFIQTFNGSLRLPHAAIVFVPRGVSHGWSAGESAASAVVGHYHRGHAEHLLLN